MKRVRLADGKVLRFPDATSQDVIKKTVKAIKGAKEMAPTKEAVKEEPKPKEVGMSDLINNMSSMGEGKNKAMTRTALMVADAIGSDIKALSVSILSSAGLVAKAQKENTKAIRDLIAVTGKKREVIRDENGNIKGIE